ncbi:efflux RND transporter periplasmic adaptor subunit [Telmatospirillum sp.]|uniref:efflux RND transporter periplasmic adaptor subunit n=1 Tax=Telmatospirillum sp. TaxID=2079197 RepID=UPI00283ED509|nr:efflux RND transporter periplasmic adaptor subunit [Telmatospirillum sp.]MDR3440315.1 efflux RND transporter periplasmic adaptor subunit [Telmatospirillum sp.]
MKRFLLFRPGLMVVVLTVALSACDESKPQAAAPVTPEVGVVTMGPQRVAITTELPGRTTAYRVADVRPQVGGVILKRLFTEGGEVKAGQQLYQIDPATYQASYDSARATLARAEASLKSARSKVERYKPLVAANAVGKQDYDDAVAAEQQDEADVASGKAAVETAHINLVYTKVLSPISGRIGRSSVTEGALVTTGQATALATVQELDPIYVDVTQSSTEMLRLQREMADGRLQKAGEGQAVAQLVLEDGSEYPEPGKLLFSEVTVDQGTGSVTLRAVFPNPKRLLLPGMFVHARIEEGINDRAILVPQQGVTRNQRGEATALVVGADDKVELRALKVDRTIGDKWLTTDGLKAGDRVIVEGLLTVKPGIAVHAVAAGNATPGQPGATPSAQ